MSVLPHCPKCGYTEEDQRIHGDHHLCDGQIPSVNPDTDRPEREDEARKGSIMSAPKIEQEAWGLFNQLGKLFPRYMSDDRDNFVGAFAFIKETDAKSIALSDESVRPVVIMDKREHKRLVVAQNHIAMLESGIETVHGLVTRALAEPSDTAELVKAATVLEGLMRGRKKNRSKPHDES